MSIEGVIFDKDDTLIDLAVFWREPIRKTVDFLMKNCDCDGDVFLKHKLELAAGYEGDYLLPESPVVAGTNKDVINACVVQLILSGIPTNQKLVDESLNYLEYACMRYGTVVGISGVETVLPQLKDKGLKLGIASSDNYNSVIHCLNTLGILQYFDLILTADLVSAPKPSPDMARIFCRECGVLPQNTVMVGDSKNDMLFAQNSGLKGVFFQKGAEERELPTGANCIISDLNELPELLSYFI